jgi:alpha-L-fucosidase
MMPQKKAEELTALVHEIQPNCMVSDRVGPGAGDYAMMGDCAIPGGILNRAWESCDSISDDWGYRKDVTWQSPAVMIRKLVDVTSKGGNYLLNVGPTAEGDIPQPSVDRLAVIGRWMKVNGESIWGTTPSPFGVLPWGCCTAKSGKIYLHVFDWPENGRLKVPGLRNTILKAYLLEDMTHTKLAVEREKKGNVIIVLPDEAPDDIDTVVVLDIKGKPDIEGIVDWVEQAEDGTIVLNAIDAKIHGTKLRYQTSSSTGNIGCWTESDDYATWKVKITRPGAFFVKLTYACAPGVGGSKYSLTIAGQELTGQVKDTDYWGKFTQEKVGIVDIKTPGEYILTVKPKIIAHGTLMNLATVALTTQK